MLERKKIDPLEGKHRCRKFTNLLRQVVVVPHLVHSLIRKGVSSTIVTWTRSNWIDDAWYTRGSWRADNLFTSGYGVEFLGAGVDGQCDRRPVDFLRRRRWWSSPNHMCYPPGSQRQLALHFLHWKGWFWLYTPVQSESGWVQPFYVFTSCDQNSAAGETRTRTHCLSARTFWVTKYCVYPIRLWSISQCFRNWQCKCHLFANVQ